ncbi:MAG: hypothetical protein ACLP6E_17020 [Acidimicrobiales bacterium]
MRSSATLRKMVTLAVTLISLTAVLATIVIVPHWSNGAPPFRRLSDPHAEPAGRAASQAAATSSWKSFLGTPKVLTASDDLPADCIPKLSGPPGSPYQLGLVGTVNDGVLMAGPARIADITAKFCGVVTVVKGQPPCGATGSVYSPPDGQIFGSLSAELTLIPGMDPKVPFTAHPGTISGGFGCGSSTHGLVVNLKATVSGSTGLYGLSCTIGPLTIPLSGAVTGPLSNVSVTLRGNDFAVPGVRASPTCSGQVPSNLDALAGLPIAPGGASATLPVTGSLYQPGP